MFKMRHPLHEWPQSRIGWRDRFEREGDVSLHSCNNDLSYTFSRDGVIAQGEAVVFTGKVRKEVS